MVANNKNSTKNNNLSVWLVVTVIILVAVAATLWFSKAWLKRAYYGYQARNAFGGELQKLRDPLDTLGFKGVTKEASKCTNAPIYGYTDSQLQCISQHDNYVVIGNDESSKTLTNSKAQSLDNLLKSDHWVTTSNSATSFSEWFQGITHGKDYSTDINSVRNVGKTHCSLAINVAYSSPNPPAYIIRISCASPILEKTKDNTLFQ